MPDRVSIIIPCFNAAATVVEAVESALVQSVGNVEVIVVDDGSTDGSCQLLNSYAGRVLLESGPNLGGCAARNRGLALASGRWIQFLDADDVLHPTKLERQLAVSRVNPGRIVYADHVLIDEEGQKLGARSLRAEHDDALISVLEHRTLHTSGPLYRAEDLLAVGGFREGLNASQEFELNCRLAQYWSKRGVRLLHLAEPLFTVRRQRQSVSSDTARTFAALAEPMEEFVLSLDNENALSAERRAVLARYLASIGRQCLRGGQVKAGERLIDLGLHTDARSAALAWGGWSSVFRRLFGVRATEKLARLRSELRLG
ncbi:MAG: glycosyltransferase [Lysobacterales bacterium]